MTTYEDTISMIGRLNEQDLGVVNSLVRRLVLSTPLSDDDYKPLSEEEFFERLAIARRHASEGKVKDAHEVATNVRKKYGLA